jgi:hypothetical protein
LIWVIGLILGGVRALCESNIARPGLAPVRKNGNQTKSKGRVNGEQKRETTKGKQIEPFKLEK